jgi:SAM-dependent methyltransferase
VPERVRAVARRLPRPLGGWLERSHQRFVGARWERGNPVGAGDVLPVPGPELLRRVSGHEDVDTWLRSGEQDAALIRGLVKEARRPMESLDTILDFGCGCGRVARWWSGLDEPALHGCDYDGLLTAWCRTHLPFMRVKTNASRPPLPYRDGSFDLVYAISLFTHLAEEAQDGWLRDVRRVLRPGGLFLFTVHGQRFLGHLSAGERERFAAGQHVVKDPDLSGMEGCSAFHSAAYVHERMLPSAGFVVISEFREPGGNDYVPSPLVLQDTYLAVRA